MNLLNAHICVGIFIAGVILFLLCLPIIKKIYMRFTEIINYLIIGVLTTVISLILYYGLVFTILNPENGIQLQIANIISWIGSVIFAYITNRKFVFRSNNKNTKKEFFSFVSSRVITLLMDMLIMFVGVTVIHGSDKIFKLISQFVVIVSNYIFSKLFVFKKKD